jgi:hypothetical protein
MCSPRLGSHPITRQRGCASRQLGVASVRFGSKADIQRRLSDVRFTPKSGHQAGSTARFMSSRPSHTVGVGASSGPR